ncbi:alpha/beta hydrolase [Longispora sp. NPDC051575]|uniref:alpha/beta hydrolase n=1 Tax=Longispora sp. NPDC051575 TaxID=3154943 RepID=UPI00342DCFE5
MTPFTRLRLAAGTALVAMAATLAVTSPAGATADSPPAQTLTWSTCADGYECATAAAPLDYDRPRGEQISLSLIRMPATDPARRIGSLFVNFGGPGASGVDRLQWRGHWDWLFSPELRARFDVVSWDTRGVGRSTAIRCFETKAEQEAYFNAVPAFPATAAQEPAFYAQAADLTTRCKERGGDLINHLSTANTARDLDVMRRAVGDEKLSYLGLSYGTHVGATYANLFPNKFRALVLDGALDFQGSATGHGIDGLTKPIDTRQDVPRGLAETFDQFLTQCQTAGPERCAFAKGDVAPKARFKALTDRARVAPIVLDGESWSYTTIVSTVQGNLAHPLWWKDLATLLDRLANVQPAARAFGAVREATPKLGEQYLDNRSEAYFAINCTDSVSPRHTSTYSRLAEPEDRRVPYFGRIGVFGYMPCATWPGRDTDRFMGPWNTPTAAPILVVNNRYDPSTPLHGAQDGTAELANAQLMVIEGAGHTGMYTPSTCGEKAKRDYLFTGVLPPKNLVCAADDSPF